ncbi:histidine kinase [Halarcobacter mediterraneus]|uniref:histidine kinase n=1 Tax=Halarcobacter mediterraneus TaxID=2023153 RepID=A0A4Q1B2M7_9BACT|nr:cache domain-containing protein [Halarcobacter mediterraneus]RXK14641.1 histidine kinase [Halarcobacter mediterraneus]
MESKYSERTILTIIKYGALIPIIIFSFLITYLSIKQKDDELNHEIKVLKEKFLQENKENVKNEVYRVIDSINYEIKSSDEALKTFLKDKVYEAYQIADNIYKEETKKNKPKEEIYNTIKLALGGMIYNEGTGYIFLDDINGVKQLQPFNRSFEGRNFLHYEDAKGYRFVETIVQTIKDKTETYDTYYWYKSKEDKTAYKKMSFYKYFEPFDVAIGTGEYLVDFEKRIQQNLLKRIRNIRFNNNNGYIFIFDSKGTYLSYFEKDKIKTNGFKTENTKGKYLIKDLVEFAIDKKEGYYSYLALKKPNLSTDNNEKISFIKYFEDWDWIIGAGFYLDELNNDVKERELELIKKHEAIISDIIILSIIITSLLLLISFYISKIVSKKFDDYKNNLKEEMNRTVEKERLLIQQSKMATMGEMIGNIAHQWKQPLSIISTASTGVKLQKELETLTDKELSEAMDSINNSSQYLAQTIEDFRSFFKPNKLKQRFIFRSLYEKTFKLINSQFKNNNIQIIENIDDIELNTYENELLQVLINILKNSKDELIKLPREERRLIFVNSFSKNKQVFIKIRDNAGGIPEEIIDKIYDPYFSTKKDKEGTGIGLYMSRQIIDSMDGKIKVSNVDFTFSNKKYKGAEFTIIIPLN